MFELRKSFTFEAAHELPKMPVGHKCARLHGHSFRVTVIVRGELNAQGLVIDYGDIKDITKPIVDELDHTYLNEIQGLDNPSSEVLARWFYDRLKPKLSSLHQIQISETCTSECTYPI
ncbi:MAG: 6-carboxytetrahydropterin synthase QueD [Bdellovibrionales bacterium]